MRKSTDVRENSEKSERTKERWGKNPAHLSTHLNDLDAADIEWESYGKPFEYVWSVSNVVSLADKKDSTLLTWARHFCLDEGRGKVENRKMSL